MKHFCEKLLYLTLVLALVIVHPLDAARAEVMDLDIEAGETECVSALDLAAEEDSPFELLSSKKWKKKVKVVNWFKGGSNILRVGRYGYIYDIRTGTCIRVKRCGGVAHADLEPATKKDTYKLWKLAHGFSWDRRPVILHAGGKYVACSINTKPHGKQTIRNNGFKGQFCLHMAYSKTHGSNRVDEDHMACIRRAYNWAH